jgi:hypothetical protein
VNGLELRTLRAVAEKAHAPGEHHHPRARRRGSADRERGPFEPGARRREVRGARAGAIRTEAPTGCGRDPDVRGARRRTNPGAGLGAPACVPRTGPVDGCGAPRPLRRGQERCRPRLRAAAEVSGGLRSRGRRGGKPRAVLDARARRHLGSLRCETRAEPPCSVALRRGRLGHRGARRARWSPRSIDCRRRSRT